ncbi:MAG: hypothetical protein KDI63_15610 [Gammaproteobacteria bacterium]|nr:hypothetical protein [Gammaproteobacteria bacterium]
MADEPLVKLTFRDGCGDCGRRQVELPAPLPGIGDDFDWDVRDYDGYRLFMLEELAARFPERRNWTPADLEVVLVETLSVVLDQLSDMHDRIQAESYLETARRPDTVRRLLELIGYQPLLHAGSDVSNATELEQLWRHYPHLMEEARQAGPRSIHRQLRMVTEEDYRTQLLPHPLVLDVDAYADWSGSWHSHWLVVRLINNLGLDETLSKAAIAGDTSDTEGAFTQFEAELEAYYRDQEIPQRPGVVGSSPRTLLRLVVERQRMVGQEVLLRDATLVGIVLSLSLRIGEDYYRSEVQAAVRAALVDQADSFFAPGRLGFGEDVVASDIIEVLMVLDGVESVCVNRLKRVGSIYPDQSGSGRIPLEGYEVAVLEDDVRRPERGALRITLHGGKSG